MANWVMCIVGHSLLTTNRYSVLPLTSVSIDRMSALIVCLMVGTVATALLLRCGWPPNCLYSTTATQRPHCWSCVSSRPGSATPELTDHSDALLGPHPKCRELAFWADLSKVVTDIATRDIANCRISSTTSWRGLGAAEQLLIIFWCESTIFTSTRFRSRLWHLAKYSRDCTHHIGFISISLFTTNNKIMLS